MAVFSTIRISELEGSKRIDAEYYNPEYLDLLSRLRKSGCIKLKQIAIPIKRKFKPNDGEYFDYIEISKVDLITSEFNLSKIIGENAPDRAQWVVLKEDILVSTVRPIRNAVTLIRENKENLVCSSGFCIIHPKQQIQTNYLFLYLKMPFVARLLDRQTTATEYPAVNWNDVLDIPIYLGSEKLMGIISSLVDKAFNLLEQSQYFYSQAENLLLEELGLKDFKLEYKKTYITNLSNFSTSHRIDAEYFQPAYDEVIEKIKEKNIEMKPLRKFILNIKQGIEPGSENYKEEGTPFIRVSNLSINGFNSKDQKYLNKELYQKFKETYEPGQGDFLLTKDATPGIAYVVKEQIEGIISSGILKLQIDEHKVNKEYLAFCINSLVGTIQVKRDGGGSVIIHWKPEQIKILQIPLLPPGIQQKIASLVQRSHEAREESKELIEIGKKAIEIVIEKNEDEAIHFLDCMSKQFI